MRLLLALFMITQCFVSGIAQVRADSDSAVVGSFVRKVTRLNEKGYYQDALDLGTQALAIYTRMKDSIGIGIAYLNIGNDFQYLGSTARAIENYLRACTIFQAIGDKADYLRILNDISSVFIDLGEFDKAYGYAVQSVRLARELKDTSHMATGLIK